MKRYYLAITIFMFGTLYAQLPFPMPARQDTSFFGANIQRTMHLLQSSTPTNRNTVKIMVYGQSISEQAWSDSLKRVLEQRFPNARLIMINRSIGAHSSQLLKKPMFFDVGPFYPDLVIFHVYGSHVDLDSIMQHIRSKTTAEVLFQNSHVASGDFANGSWENTYGYVHMVNIAKKYGLEYADVRTPWYKYLTDNNITVSQATSDGLHLNDRGNFLLSRLLRRYTYRNTNFTPDPLGLVTTYVVGTDINWSGNELTLPFNGNKIEIIAGAPIANMDNALVSIDGISPSMHAGVYMPLRPTLNNENDWKNGWPWNVGGPMKVTNNAPLVAENWALTINSVNISGNNRIINFSVGGSQTGFDGSGSVTYVSDGNGGYNLSGNTFVSTSGRVVIHANDWFLYLGIVPSVYSAGNIIRWTVKQFATNIYTPPLSLPANRDSVIVIAQGLSNGPHTLRLLAQGSNNVPIKAIRVYRPYLYRKSNSNQNLPNPSLRYDGNTTAVVNRCTNGNGMANIFNKATDLNTSTGVVTYWQVTETSSGKQTRAINPAKITVAGVYKIAKSSSNNTTSEVTITVQDDVCVGPFLLVQNPVVTLCSNLTYNLTTAYSDIYNTEGPVWYYAKTVTSTPITNAITATAPGIYYIKKTDTNTGVSFTTGITLIGQNCIPKLAITSPIQKSPCFAINLTDSVVDLKNVPGTTEYYSDTLQFTTFNPAQVTATGTYFIWKTSDAGYTDKVKVSIQNNPAITINQCTNLPKVEAPDSVAFAPPCASSSISIRSLFEDVNSVAGTWYYFINPSSETPYNPDNITTSGVYYARKTNAMQNSSQKSIVVTINITLDCTTEVAKQAIFKDIIRAYPNPNNTGTVHFTKPVSGILLTNLGTPVLDFENSNSLSIASLSNGIYIIAFKNGNHIKLIVQK